MLENVQEVQSDLSDLPKYVMGRRPDDVPEGYYSLDDLLQRTPPAGICKQLRENVTMTSNVCYIYTSGTTGRVFQKMIMAHYYS